jgi:hypothetical protein
VAGLLTRGKIEGMRDVRSMIFGVPPFSRRDVLTEIALCTLGFACWLPHMLLPEDRIDMRSWRNVLPPYLVMAGWALIGAGLMAPRKRMVFGAVGGVIAMVIVGLIADHYLNPRVR